MKYVAAYAMIVLGGKDAPSADEVEKVVKDAGATADKEVIIALCKAMEGKAFEDLVATGMNTLASMGTGSEGASAVAPEAGKKDEEAKAEVAEEDD